MQNDAKLRNLPTDTLPAEMKPTGAPEVGSIKKGYRFKGGDPADEKNWEKVQ
jgi:hypothetical protein